MRQLIRSFAEHGGTVLVSSHVLAEISQSVDRVVIIDGGRVVADAPVTALAGRGTTLEDAYIELTSGAIS